LWNGGNLADFSPEKRGIAVRGFVANYRWREGGRSFRRLEELLTEEERMNEAIMDTKNLIDEATDEAKR